MRAVVMVALGVAGWLATEVAVAQEATAGPGTITVHRTEDPVEIDGVLDEPAWAAAAVVPLPFEILPADNAPAQAATECRLAFDVDHLYFGCVALDPRPEDIRAFLTDRDQIDGQDAVGLMVDPFLDRRRSFAFQISPLGVQNDFVFDQSGGGGTWDAIWRSAGRITPEGYVVEAAVPFKSLRFPSTDDVQSWGFFFWRDWPRSQSVSMRSVPLDQSNNCSLCQMATVRGFQAIEPGRNLELLPSVTAQRTDERAAPDDPLSTGAVADEYGLDLRWSVSSDLTLNFTANPDFSQVEADALQLQSNQQFALFFPERRPFFVEGAEFFETPLRAVFTRTIADPSVGSKVTGKLGAWAVGALAARDQRTNLLLPGSQASRSTSLELDNTAFLARARRDVGGVSTVGLLGTAREGTGYHNRVAGVDAAVQVHPTLEWTAQVLRSETRYPAATSTEFDQPEDGFAGWAWRTQGVFQTRNWWIQSFVQNLDPGFRADAGFVTQADFQQFDLRGTRTFWTDDPSRLTSWRITSGTGRMQESDGDLIAEFVFMALGLQGPLQSDLSINPDRFRRDFGGRRFLIDRLNVSGRVQPSARLRFQFFGQFGEELDFANVREAGLLRLSPSASLRLGRRVDLGLETTLKQLDDPEGRRIFSERIAQGRAVLYFTNRAFLRAVLQLRDVERDPELYIAAVDPRSRSLTSQLLFSYKLNPQSVVFLGYSDASLGPGENLEPEALELYRVSRTFFLKLSYAWRP